MAKKIRIEVYKRLVFAKWLQLQGESAVSHAYDDMRNAMGILLLHDAAEATLGAIADYLNVSFSGNKYLPDYYDLISQKDPGKRTVPYRIQMNNLNKIRNDVKHHGIFPSYNSVSHFPATVYALLEELCSTYLEKQIDSINLTSLIKDGLCKNYIIEAESHIENNNYEQALVSLAYSIFHLVESSTLTSGILRTLLNEKDDGQEFEFTKPYGTDYTVKLLEHGVEPYIYHRFRNLTPHIGQNKKTKEIQHCWEKQYGHPANWTKKNAQFCLGFAIDTALKFQREKEYGYELIDYQEAFMDIIKPSGEEAVFLNNSQEIFRLKKGEEIIGYASDSVGKLDEWLVISPNLPKTIADIGFAYVKKDEVIITSIPIPN